MFGSSSQFYIKTLNFMKYFGLIRIKLEVTKQNEIVQVGYHKFRVNSVFTWLNCIFLLLHSFHLCTHLYTWARFIYLGHSDMYLAYIFIWTAYSGFTLFILMKFHLNYDKLCKLLTEWLQVERNIGSWFGDQAIRNKFHKKQRRLCKMLTLFYGGYKTVAIAYVFHTYGKYGWVPLQLFRAEWFSPESQSHRNNLNLVASQFYYLYFALIASVFEVFATTFSHSVSGMIFLISYNCRAKNPGTGANDLDGGTVLTDLGQGKAAVVEAWHLRIFEPHGTIEMKFDNCLAEFYKLKSLVHQFDYFSAWILLAYKGYTLAASCVCVYSMVEFIQDLGNGQEGKPALIAFVIIILVQFVRLSIMLMSMGMIPESCKHFRNSWAQILDFLSETQQPKLVLSEPFALSCGSFYKIQPSAILSYFSIITTYVIVGLQIFNVQK